LEESSDVCIVLASNNKTLERRNKNPYSDA
jgi:hypothetical protein